MYMYMYMYIYMYMYTQAFLEISVVMLTCNYPTCISSISACTWLLYLEVNMWLYNILAFTILFTKIAGGKKIKH